MDGIDAEVLVPLLSQPVAVVSVAGRIGTHTVSFAQKAGLGAAQGAHVFDLLQTEDRATLQRFMEQVQSGEQPEAPLVLPIGMRAEGARLTLSPLRRGGDLRGFLAQITEEADAHDGTQRYLMDHLDLGVWDFNVPKGTFTVSDAWRRMRGLDRSEDVTPLQNGWQDHVHPDDRHLLRQVFDWSDDETNRNVVLRYRWRHKAGHWVWILSRASVMDVDAAGQPVKIVGTDTEIKEVDESEEALFRLTGKLQLAIEASGMGIWEFDPNTAKVHWDDRMLEMYGILDGQNIRSGGVWEKFLHPEDKAETVAYALECERKNADFRRDYRILRPDGQVRHIRSLARNVSTAKSDRKLIGVNFDVTKDYLRAQELELARRKLEYDSRHDALTGLGNRRKLDETALALFGRLQAEDRFVVMQMDLDHFKTVNDTQGHAAGDHVLSVVAQELRRIIGVAGQVFRTGGDEFVVLFEEMPEEDGIEQMCSAMVAAVNEPILFEGQPCAIGLSIGYTICTGPPDNPSDPFVNADAALYAAKRAGRGRFLAYSGEMAIGGDVAFQSNRHALMSAIKNREMLCYYQPQYDAKTLQIVGAEALVRWQCPERGLLTPDRFLPQIEEFNLTQDLDECVFDLVIRQQTEWADSGLSFPPVSINVSKARLESEALLAQVKEVLTPRHAITFELLETSFYDRVDTALAFKLDLLRDLGVRIALDDFGAGHSSIVALQALKPDRVKIDRSLVQPIQTNPDQVLTLQSLSRIARLEGAEITVVGLETGLHLAAIRSVDCDMLQGYALQRPMSALAFSALLRREGEGRSSA